MASAIYFRHPAVLAHDIPGHPERPERIRALEAALEPRSWCGYSVREAPLATREQLLRVHPASHVDFVEELCAAGGGMIDADTAAVRETWEAALAAAGGAVAVVDALLGDGVATAVSATRPPGHHATADRAMGFCFFSNAAVAARHALAAYPSVERVLVLDWDVHHGNGTNDIFHADDDVLFVSLHEYPLYPGTGPASDVGSGSGRGFTVNLPMPGGSGDEAWVSMVEHVAVPIASEYEPQLVLISAGFDAHYRDPLATCRLTEAGYVAMTSSLRRLADSLDAPLGLVLEGGYSVEALADSMCALMPVLAGFAPCVDPPVGMHPLTIKARERFDAFWPGLATSA